MTCDKCKDTPGWVEILDPRNVDEDGNARPEKIKRPSGCTRVTVIFGKPWATAEECERLGYVPVKVKNKACPTGCKGE